MNGGVLQGHDKTKSLFQFKVFFHARFSLATSFSNLNFVFTVLKMRKHLKIQSIGKFIQATPSIGKTYQRIGNAEQSSDWVPLKMHDFALAT